MSNNSYVAAGNMPWKLLKNHHTMVKDGNIKPVHIQLIPTNRCNGNCDWCSCSAVDRTLELETSTLLDIVDFYRWLGTKAMTITGGGEPTLHRGLQNVLQRCMKRSIQVGMVTNGLIWSKYDAKELELPNAALTWLRISVVDTVGDYDVDIIANICKHLPAVDIGISFTVADAVNLETASKVCRLAEDTDNITHVRFVQDILNAGKSSVNAAMNKVRKACKDLSPKAIFQFRDTYTCGVKQCFISLLKPVINADGYVYPCCGAQYATDELNTMPKSMRMCHWSDFSGAEVFDGTICKRCYYNDYNVALCQLLNQYDHAAFV